MVQHGIVSLHVVVSGLCQLKAKFHIIIGNGHRLIESTHFFILCPSHHQTRRRHADHVIGHPVMPIVVVPVVLEGHQLMGRPDPQVRDTHMLDLSCTGIP